MLRRRDLIAAGSTALLAASVIRVQAQQPATPPGTADGGAAPWDDGLAHPIPYQPAPGAGKERGLVLGGGGIYLASWMAGYMQALKSKGVDLATADVIVGTSAGSLIGAMLTSGHLWRFGVELDIFTEFPKIFTLIVPTMAPNASQIRARHIADTAVAADPATIQAIGRGAMAARNTDGPSDYFNAVKRVIGVEKWPSPKLHTTANDCYTGERIVVSADDGIEVNHACAASSSLPGSMGPTWLKNRLCMDGGICQTSTHSDVVAGVKKALIISLTDGGADASKIGLRTSSLPNTLQQEVSDLKAQGTEVILKVVGLMPGATRVDSLMDPKWIGPCLKNGNERGLADIEEMKAFWGA